VVSGAARKRPHKRLASKNEIAPQRADITPAARRDHLCRNLFPRRARIVGLRGRNNERDDFLITTTPPVDETAAASNALLVFPHLAVVGGYSAQFIVFSGWPVKHQREPCSFSHRTANRLN